MSNMTDEEKKEYRNAVRVSKQIDERSKRARVTGDYGLCTGCAFFSYREYELGHRVISVCSHHNIETRHSRLSSAMRVTKCSEYSRKGSMSLETMWLLAKHINNDNKQTVGFGLSNAEEHDLYILEAELDDGE